MPRRRISALWRGIWFALLAVAVGGLSGSVSAATGALDATPANLAPPSSLSGTINPDKPGAGTLTGNPLWAVPLSVLSITRERPLFSPSRRPIAPAVVAAPVVVAALPRKPPEPDHPPLTLVGTIIGGAENIAIFADEATKNFIRLKTGQDHAGWTLRAIFGRETTFARGDREATLGLPARNVSGRPMAAGAPLGLAAPVPRTPSLPPPQAATWRDGDGQLITPPPSASAAASDPLLGR